MFGQLHTNITPLNVIPAGNGSTLFSIISACASSASIPVLVDELKPRDMDPKKAAGIRDTARNNYVGATIKRGNVSGTVGPSKLGVTEDVNGAPLCLIGEALETETAMRERTIEVALTKESRSGRDHENAMRYCRRHKLLISTFGRSAMEVLVNPDSGMTIGSVAKILEHYTDKVMDMLPNHGSGMDRPAHNLAVVLTGWEFAKSVLQVTFGDLFDERVEAFQNILLNSSDEVVPDTQSELAKVLDSLARASQGTGRDETTPQIGREYTVSDDGESVDISVKSIYTKYRLYCGDLRDKPLYDTLGAFMMALKHYGGTLDNNVLESPLKLNPITPVVRLSVSKMAREGVEPFRSHKR
jgi:hypothetical protein